MKSLGLLAVVLSLAAFVLGTALLIWDELRRIAGVK
jgi:hypothetical protein